MSEKSVHAILTDLARITGRPVNVTADPLMARMQIVAMVAEAKFEQNLTWAQVGEIIGTGPNPVLAKKAIKNIAGNAQKELAGRAMSMSMADPVKIVTPSACTSAGKDT